MFAHSKPLPQFSFRRFCIHALFWMIAFTGAAALFVIIAAASLGLI